MHVDISIRAVFRAQPATDAPVFDNHFQRIAAPYGANRTAHHAQRIAALPAGGSHQIFLETQPLADQARHAVVRIGAGSHASVAARAAFQIQYQQTLRLHQTLSQKMIQRHAGGRRQTLLILLLSLPGQNFQAAANLWELLHHLVEFFSVDTNQLHVIQRRAGGGAASSAQQSDFPEISAAAEIRQHQFATRMRFRYLHESDTDQIEIVRDVALVANDVVLAVPHQLHLVAQQVDEIRRQGLEHRNAAQLVFQGALLVVRIQLRFEGLVALDDIQHVAQHFQHHAIRGRAYSCRARIQAHAGHFAEQIARPQRSHRIIVRQIYRSINRDSAPLAFLFPPLLRTAGQAAGEFAEEAGRTALSLDVRHRGRKVNLRVAFHNVKRGGTVLALAAHDLALLEMAADHGALIELQESPGYFLEIRKFQQLFNVHRLARQYGFHHALVGQSAGWTGHHALPARDARGIAHGQVIVEGDAGHEAFTSSTEHIVVLDLIASANAAVA